MQRREMVAGMGAVGACALARVVNGRAAEPATPPGPVTLPPLDGLPLKDRAARRGLIFGSMVQHDYLVASPAYAAAVARDCAMVVPGVEAKWWGTEPADGVFTFAKLDAIASYAAANAMQLRCHNLAWNVWNPPWLQPALAAPVDARAILERHIATVAGRYAGRAAAWDVVNECADPRWPSDAQGLCRGLWWQAVGPDFAERAFRAAHRADPKALLFVNDDWLEYPESAKKRAIYLRLVEGWLRRGVPIHGFGLEAHLRPDATFDAREYRRFLAELAGMGLVIHVTELDVVDRSLPADLAARDARVADLVARYLDVVLDEPAVKAVLTWGLSDQYSDLDASAEARRTDGLPARGAPLDAAFRPKPFWRALAHAFDHAPARA